jgi:NADH dehydrogenase
MKRVRRVLLLGGSGFIGSAVAARLVADSMEVNVPTRRLTRAMHLALLPTARIIEADIDAAGVLESLTEGMDAVVYLPGILHGDFETVHVALPERAACAAAAARASHFVHMSALGAAMTAPSRYLQSKERGEAALARVAQTFQDLRISILRPSVVFGERDRFLNLFASLAALTPVIPLASPGALFQPVWVEDVARAVHCCLTDPHAAGRGWPLVGPHRYTLRELVELVLRLTGRRRVILPLSEGLANLQAAILERLPGKLLTRDNLASMRVPSISDVAYPFGVPGELETIATRYLSRTPLVDDYLRGRATAGR